MDTAPQLVNHVRDVLQKVVLAPVIIKGEISSDKFSKPRMRAQALLEKPEDITMHEKEGEMTPVMDQEVKHCATVIVAAFLNPIFLSFDFDRFAESAKKRESDKYYEYPTLGFINKPATLLDMHGKILMWYLPGLLLPPRVKEFNEVTKCLKKDLRKSIKAGSNWRSAGFEYDPKEATFGAGRLSLSIGKLLPGHQRLEDPLRSSPNLESKAVRSWLRRIKTVEQLLDAVLHVVNPEMYDANILATPQLLEELDRPVETWPSVYHAMDVIVNRVTPSHCDPGGANSFYDHLVSLGQDHDARLLLDSLEAEFAYQAGTSALFTGKVLSHSVPKWSEGERIVIAHYAKDNVQDRLGVPRPLLPSQMSWWSKHGIEL